MTKLVIGLGTGRSGTSSLSALLNRQSDAFVTHERSGNEIKWQGSEGRIKALLEEAAGSVKRLYGDIGFYYLPYVEFILQGTKEVKFICIQRSKKETVRSYLIKTRGRNHWYEHNGKFWDRSAWDDCYPRYPFRNKSKALRRYWEDYYARSSELAEKYPQNFAVFQLSDLNTGSGQRRILSFLEIPENEQNLLPFNIKNKLEYNWTSYMIHTIKRFFRSLLKRNSV